MHKYTYLKSTLFHVSPLTTAPMHNSANYKVAGKHTQVSQNSQQWKATLTFQHFLLNYQGTTTCIKAFLTSLNDRFCGYIVPSHHPVHKAHFLRLEFLLHLLFHFCLLLPQNKVAQLDTEKRRQTLAPKLAKTFNMFKTICCSL